MKDGAPGSLLEHYAAPIAAWLARDDVNEIAVNPDGAVWIERAGAAAMERTEIRLSANDVRQFAKIVAGGANLVFSAASPIVSADLPGPGGGARVQVVAPPAASGVGAIAIRKLGVSTIDIDAMGFLDPARPLMKAADIEDLAEAERAVAAAALTWPDLARLAIDRRWNVLFSGGTSSGKTTAANAMIRRISDTDRIITIEDVRELDPPQPNRVALIADRTAGSGRAPVRLLEAVLRLRPDRFIFGEIRGEDAAAYLEVVNTGHPGSLCTMHANSPQDAIARLSKMARRGADGMTDAEVRSDIRRTIQLIVQTGRVGGRRGVQGVMFPALE